MVEKSRRRSSLENGDHRGRGVVDDVSLASCIRNGENLGPIIRAAFEMGKPEALLHQLRNFVNRKEVEIEDLCKVHYDAVDELRGVLVDADELKHGLVAENSQMQEVGNAVLSKLDELIEAHATKQNLTEAITSLKICEDVMDMCVRANKRIKENLYYPALKLLDSIERYYLSKVPSRALVQMLERQISVMKRDVEKSVTNEFNEWLVQIRSISRDIGQQLIGQISSARRKEMELQVRLREGAESGEKKHVYLLDIKDDDDDFLMKMDLVPVYRAHHIHTCLRIHDQFHEYYYKNRELQLNSDLQFSSMQSFLELHQLYFAQIAGFFVVEDKVQRTAGDLMRRDQVETMWEFAVSKMITLTEDQLLQMETANHMLIVKDYVSRFCAALKDYGYFIAPLLEVLDKKKDRYHELLLEDCRMKITECFANDCYGVMIIKKEQEYKSNILAFHLQSSSVMPALPYIAPFSASVPDCCRIIKSFIEDSVSFMAYGSHVDFYDVVKAYLDKLLITVVNAALLKLINSTTVAVSHAMQIAANITVLEHACQYFALYAAQLCGFPTFLVDKRHAGLGAKAVLHTSQRVAHEKMLTLVKSKVDEFMQLMATINWVPDGPPCTCNDYLNEVIIYLETLAPTAQQILPLDMLDAVFRDLLKHISDTIVGKLVDNNVRKFNVHAIMGIDADLKVLESFADEKYQSTPLRELPGSTNLRHCLAEGRQLVILFTSNQPDMYLNPVIREKNYSALDNMKVLTIAEKYKDLPDTFFARNPKNAAKRKAVDLLVKGLKEG